MTRLIVGLGNPGRSYDETRHNVGFRVVKVLASKYALSFRPSIIRAKGSLAKGKVGEREILLLLPMTYMNESGLSVRKTIDYYKIPFDQLIVVTDDVELPFGKIRIRTKGSCGGHNGLRSIESHLGTQEYPRLRIGVGRGTQGELADYVLGKFNEEEQRALPDIVERAVHALDLWLAEGIETAMRKY